MRHAATRFVSNAELWEEIQHRVAKASRVMAAVAFLGDKGADLLRLKRGSCLVVDMSINTVRTGMTDPYEVRKLIKRGVQVFSRSSLHAKFILADRALIVSSANVSHNSLRVLDEAGMITTDPSAIRRASDLFKKLCTEPVRPQYLKKCIAAYKPPTFTAKTPRLSRKDKKRIVQAKLWFVGGVEQITPSEKDAASIEKLEKRAEKMLRHPEKTEVSWIRYDRRPKFLNHIRDDDWVVDCTTDGGPRYVEAPAQVLGQEIMTSPRGKKYHMLLLERPDAGQPMSLAEFRRKTRSLEPLLNRKNPRTRAIEDTAHADAIQLLWTPSGRVRRAQ